MKDSREKKLRTLLSQLDGPSIDEDDLKQLCLCVITEIDGDTPLHHKAKLDAIRLLKELVVKEKVSEGISNDNILSLLGGKDANTKSN